MADEMKPFGLNIKVPKRTIKQSQDTITTRVNSVWQPLFNFIQENQQVFNGSIAEEIEKYNLMSYNTGAILRNSSPKTNFDIKG